MKAQELRDKLAPVRSFSIIVDGKEVKEVVTDIAKQTVYICTKETEPTKTELKPPEAGKELKK